MIRARNPENDKLHYLLQKRGKDGTWGVPGGKTHVGEDPWDAAFRETTEEIGKLPPLSPRATIIRRHNDKLIHLFVADAPWFAPDMSGRTPEETHGTGWFRRKEVGDLELHPAFREQWESVDWDDLKKQRRAVSENGELLYLDDEDAQNRAAGGGARYPYPRRADGAEVPQGSTAGEMGATEPPQQQNSRGDFSDVTSARLYPRGEDEDFPQDRKPNRPAGSFPEGLSGLYPMTSSLPQPGVSTAGARRGTVKQRPVTGSVSLQAPEPADPHAEQPEPFDPADAVVYTTPEGNVVPDDSATQVARKGKGGPGDYADANPVDPEHVLNLMRSNFAEDAIQWVKRARWVGPVNIPWERIDTSSVDSWAASRQPDAVNRFAADIKANRGHTNPSILIQDKDVPKAVIVDGHHRALARRKLDQPILAYLGNIDPRDRQAAEETHSKQQHSGADPQNR